MTTQSSARLSLPYLVAGQAQKEVTHNEALVLLDAGIGASAESVGLNAPPASPAIGQCWIVGPAPQAGWTGRAHSLAVWTEGGWRFLPAIEGMRVWLKDQQLWATRRTTAWIVGEEVTTRLLVGGVQVVGNRGAAIAGPAGGPTIDTEARAAIEAILARLRAHGLIDS
jgi:hypothetical protein